MSDMITVYADPHQGLNLAANTTPHSRVRLQKSIDTTLGKIVSREGQKVCLGDFFHKFQNTEEVLMQAVPHAKGTAIILGGNHDVTNDVNRKSTLDVIDAMFPDKVVLPKFGKVVVTREPIGKANFVSVPHHSSTELFEKALAKAVDYLAGNKAVNYLLLHCNYESGFATQDTALNITKKQAKKLLDSGFDYILIGHDHHHKTDLDDRVIVLGNIHPTNFGDICDKYVLEISAETGEVLGLTQCWGDEKYISVDFSEVDKVDPTFHQFVMITGKAEPSQITELSRSIKRLWDAKDCGIFAIRSEVRIISDLAEVELAGFGIGELKITEIIESELKNEPELLAMWKEITNVEAS